RSRPDAGAMSLILSPIAISFLTCPVSESITEIVPERSLPQYRRFPGPNASDTGRRSRGFPASLLLASELSMPGDIALAGRHRYEMPKQITVSAARISQRSFRGMSHLLQGFFEQRHGLLKLRVGGSFIGGAGRQLGKFLLREPLFDG